MNDQLVKEAFWSDPFSTLLEQAVWLEWLQPLLYFLLTVAIASLVFSLLDMALMCWKEFRSPATHATRSLAVSSHNKMAQVQTVTLRSFFRW